MMKHTARLVKLNNGSKGLLIDVPDSSVMNFDFNFRAGDYLSPRKKWDTAHLLEHMVLGANKKYRNSSDFSKEFSKNGAFNNASTATYHMSYIADCADFEAERILDLLCLAIEAPLFLESEFEAEHANVKEELKGLRNNHFSDLTLRIGEAMGFCDLSYNNRSKQLDNINLSDIRSLYKKTHIAPNLRFMIAGNIGSRRKKILERIENMDLDTNGSRIELPTEEIRALKKPLAVKNKTIENVYYRWEAVIGHVLSEPEDDAISALFGSLLGTFHSRIFGKAREIGLAYHIGYSRYRTLNNHVWWIGGQVMPKNIESLFNLFVDELKAVARGEFAESEMNATKQFALGNFQKGFQTVGQLIDGYSEQFIFNDKIENYFKIPQRIEALKREDIINIARLCLGSNNPWAIGFYGATKDIKTNKLKKILSEAYNN
jgi:predicted Zn-dependent peptidase